MVPDIAMRPTMQKEYTRTNVIANDHNSYVDSKTHAQKC